MKMIRTWMGVVFSVVSLLNVATAEDAPELLENYFSVDVPVKAQVIAVTPPAEFEQFVQKLSEAAQKDPEWYAEHSKKTPLGSPIPVYDEKLGMTQAEYDQFLKLWDSREAKKLADTSLLLEKVGDGEWKINGSGVTSALSLLRYHEATNSFKSPNGELVSIADVKAPSGSLLGAWSGKEWRYLSENSLTKMKENIAIGKADDNGYSFLIYRVQEVTSSGRPLFDKSLLIRFVAKKK